MKFSAKRADDLKEIELFVFVSIAAVHKAIEFAQDINRDDVFDGHAYRKEIAGLNFEADGTDKAPGLASILAEYFTRSEDPQEPEELIETCESEGESIEETA